MLRITEADSDSRNRSTQLLATTDEVAVPSDVADVADLSYGPEHDAWHTGTGKDTVAVRKSYSSNQMSKDVQGCM